MKADLRISVNDYRRQKNLKWRMAADLAMNRRSFLKTSRPTSIDQRAVGDDA